MRLRILRLFLGFAAFAWGISFVGVFTNSSQAAENSSVSDSIRHETIPVPAPFAMPAIAVPVFPQRTFVVTNFGAVEGADISAAVLQAIAACHDAGGGSVVIPRGRWLTSKIHFQSNVNLHLAEGALLQFSSNPQDYLPAEQSRTEE